MPKLVGHFKNMPVYEDPNAPEGQLYIINEENMQGHIGTTSKPVQFVRIDARNHKQRIVDFVKNSYNQLMKKHYIILGVLVVVAVALAAVAVQKYQTAPKGLTTVQAVHQRDTALTDLKIQKSLTANDQTAITNLKTSNATYATQKATLCAQIKAARLVQPVCTQ